MPDVDVLVIGAGFGGLGAALALAERGARVRVHEALTYPGGCASTFHREGFRLDAGATLSSGLAPEQLFGRWIRRHRLPVTLTPLDPVVELRLGGEALPVDADRARFVERLATRARDPAAVRRFFAWQREVADTLWSLFDDPTLLPPLSAPALLAHLGRAPRYLGLAAALGRPLGAVLARRGLAEEPLLRGWLDAVCQITVQCPAAEAEAPFALAAMDYFWRGTAHVHGGIGRLAEALAGAVDGLGGEVRYADRVRALTRDGAGWRVETRSGTVRADAVVANVLPAALPALLGAPVPGLDGLADRVADGWGAVMLYRGVRAPAGAESARHIELVDDPAAPFVEGNHVFVSVSGADEVDRAPAGLRTVTASTHLPAAALRGGSPAERVARVQARMRETLRRRAPEWEDVAWEAPASPRTFARFTRRPEGLVGGIPRRSGLAHYLDAGPVEPLPGLWLVGDSVFPGQSTLATALGGTRVAEAIARRAGLAAA